MATLPYTAAAYSSFTIDRALSGLYDGNTSSGFIGYNGGSAFSITVTFAENCKLSSLDIWIRQFNGNYNGFNTIQVWNSTKTTMYYQNSSLGYGSWNLSLAAADIPTASSYVITFTGLFVTNNCSVAELCFYGTKGSEFVMSGAGVFGGDLNQCVTATSMNMLGGGILGGTAVFNSGSAFELSGGVLLDGDYSIAFGHSFMPTLTAVVYGQMLPFIIGSLSMVAGGGCTYNWESSWATSGGSVLGGTSLKKQLVFAQSAPSQPDFTLTDNSITFKLEVSP